MDDTTFVVARQNPPFLCPTLFNCLTDLDLFKSWRNGTSEWQLRIVGGPGTGKVRYLRSLRQSISMPADDAR